MGPTLLYQTFNKYLHKVILVEQGCHSPLLQISGCLELVQFSFHSSLGVQGSPTSTPLGT